jgi:hypothetical protein
VEYQITSNAVASDNIWHHVCVTRNPIAKQLAIFIDGTIDSTQTVYDFSNLDGNTNARIGYSFDETSPFKGLIDDLRVYNYALTNTEVVKVMNDGVPTLQNESFEFIDSNFHPVSWVGTNLDSTNDKVVSSVFPSPYKSHSGNYSFRFGAVPSTNKNLRTLSQKIMVSGKSGDMITFGFWNYHPTMLTRGIAWMSLEASNGINTSSAFVPLDGISYPNWKISQIVLTSGNDFSHVNVTLGAAANSSDYIFDQAGLIVTPKSTSTNKPTVSSLLQ